MGLGRRLILTSSLPFPITDELIKLAVVESAGDTCSHCSLLADARARKDELSIPHFAMLWLHLPQWRILFK